MASVLICCTPAHGHVVPVLIVAKHLVEQGHDVRVLTGSHYAVKVRTSGAEFLPLPPDADIDLDNTEVDYPERAAMKPIPQLRFSVIEFFIKPVRGQVRAVDAAIAERPVDIILTEMMFMGAAILRRRPRAQRPAIATLGYVPMAASDPDVAPFGLGITPMPGPVGRLRNAVLKVVARRIFAPVYDIAGRLFDELAGEPLPPGFDCSTCRCTPIACSSSRCRASSIRGRRSRHRPVHRAHAERAGRRAAAGLVGRPRRQQARRPRLPGGRSRTVTSVS